MPSLLAISFGTRTCALLLFFTCKLKKLTSQPVTRLSFVPFLGLGFLRCLSLPFYICVSLDVCLYLPRLAIKNPTLFHLSQCLTSYRFLQFWSTKLDRSSLAKQTPTSGNLLCSICHRTSYLLFKPLESIHKSSPAATHSYLKIRFTFASMRNRKVTVS